MSRALPTTDTPPGARVWEGAVLALLGGGAWWGSAPYAAITDTTGTLRLFETVSPHPVLSQAAAALVIAFVAWRFGLPARARLAAWRAERGAALAGDVVAALVLAFTLGFYPRARATRALLLDGLAAFPLDIITWVGAAGLLAGCSIVLLRVGPGVGRAAHVWWTMMAAVPAARFVRGAAAAAFLSSAMVALLWFEAEPIATDSANYRFQAAIFAQGHVTLPPPPAPERFAYISTIVEPRWRSIVNPGWPALLALGVRAGVAWVVNPLCHAGVIALLYALGARWWDDRTGRVAALLGLTSPFLVLPAATFMSHTSALFALLLFVYLWQRMADANHAGWAAAAGLVLGWAATVRPLDAAALALPWGVWTVWRFARGRLGLGPFVCLGCGVALPLAGLGWYNAVVNGSPTTFGYTLYYGEELQLGFGSAPDLTYTRYPHTPARGLMNTNNLLNALNKVLLGWPIPALALVVPALRTGARMVADWVCASGAALVMAAYFFFVHADFMYGARYYHAAAGLLLLLAARGLLVCAAAAGARRMAAALVVCVVFACGAFYPPFVYYYRPTAPVLQGVHTQLRGALAAAQPHHAVVVVETGTSLAYGSAVWRNGAGAEGDVVFALDDGGANAQLREAYPGRTIWRYRPTAEPPRLEAVADTP